ncbi:transmembrane family 220 protein [Mucilaginibacter oryzae]|uniref:Transmembrane family 220 protein n=1 Tax=Mucilaginibacter oryzae TaxID=468058 RepID=A0A316HHB6_9SPHI|nr:transmembrane 220 family protein [Mucilaginibacter oryzae]PWK77645.1 transmembrane family 220 protein [Mucilaginibacter oryzae]
MKIFNIVWVVLFIIFAGLQYNDPDPYLWIPIYLYCAWFCYLATKKEFYPIGYGVGIVIFSGYAIYKVFDSNGLIDWFKFHHAESLVQTMKAEKPWVEEVREFFGLVICITVLGINWIYAARQDRKSAPLKSTKKR